MIFLKTKGYDLENINYHDKLLNEVCNDYGFNTRNRNSNDIFKTNLKAKALNNHRNIIKRNK